MLQNLSLQQLRELKEKLKEVQEILNPEHLDFTGLYNTSNHHALMIMHLDLEVGFYFCQRLEERDNK